ncbi:agmatine deiminase family protein [Algicola sagamiensis]|uniref:agmatine deiminase family protein n=1 Tax=Algicola sagamiensis TaxID=163869 RepID=UPI00037923F2|nr:agmatine deiminase family protein [Algicola sagamiensis]
MNAFRLPAEWYPQDAVLLTWPHKDTDWAEILQDVEPIFVQIATAILDVQQLVIAVHNTELKSHISHLLPQDKLKQVIFVETPTDDTWARDHGPITLVNQQTRQVKALNFTFNGWGGKFESTQDNAINQALFQHPEIHPISSESVDLILEGGGIESDGAGCILTTSECLLNPNRNPAHSKSQLEASLLQLLGAEKILWLDHGYLAGDDTDAHIDTLARFAPNNTIVYVQCDDPKDEHFDALQRMEVQLCSMTNTQNKPFNLIPLPWPTSIIGREGYRLPATYANYLIINQRVLVPTYDDPKDPHAFAQIQCAYPDHEVIGINCRSIIEQHGSLHCLTMQLPVGFIRQQ